MSKEPRDPKGNEDKRKILLDEFKKISELPVNLASSLTNLLVKLAWHFKIEKIRLVPADDIILPYIWVENQKLIPADYTWSKNLLAKIAKDIPPLKLHRLEDDDIPVKDGGYIILANNKGYLGILIVKVIDIFGDDLIPYVIDYLELFATLMTSVIHSKNEIMRLEGHSRFFSNPQEQVAKLLEKNQKDIAKDLIEGIAHGVANPLAVILGNQDVLEEYIRKIDRLREKKNFKTIAKIQKDIDLIFIEQRNAIERLDQLLSDLRRYSHGPKADTYRTVLNHAVEQGINLSQLRADLRNRIKLKLNASHDVQATQFALSQSLFYILKYIVEISPKSKEMIYISTEDYNQDDPYSTVLIKTNSLTNEINEDNIDIIVASYFISGYGGEVNLISEKNKLLVTIKLLPIVY